MAKSKRRDRKSKTQTSEDEADNITHFKVDRIISSRHNNKSNTTLYRVRWKGWGPADDTWEPIENVASTGHADRYVRELRAKNLHLNIPGVALIEYEDGEQQLVDLKAEKFRAFIEGNESDRDDDSDDGDADVNDFSLIRKGAMIELLWPYVKIYFEAKIVSYCPLKGKVKKKKEEKEGVFNEDLKKSKLCKQVQSDDSDEEVKLKVKKSNKDRRRSTRSRTIHDDSEDDLEIKPKKSAQEQVHKDDIDEGVKIEVKKKSSKHLKRSTRSRTIHDDDSADETELQPKPEVQVEKPVRDSTKSNKAKSTGEKSKPREHNTKQSELGESDNKSDKKPKPQTLDNDAMDKDSPPKETRRYTRSMPNETDSEVEDAVGQARPVKQCRAKISKHDNTEKEKKKSRKDSKKFTRPKTSEIEGSQVKVTESKEDSMPSTRSKKSVETDNKKIVSNEKSAKKSKKELRRSTRSKVIDDANDGEPKVNYDISAQEVQAKKSKQVSRPSTRSKTIETDNNKHELRNSQTVLPKETDKADEPFQRRRSNSNEYEQSEDDMEEETPIRDIGRDRFFKLPSMPSASVVDASADKIQHYLNSKPVVSEKKLDIAPDTSDSDFVAKERNVDPSTKLTKDVVAESAKKSAESNADEPVETKNIKQSKKEARELLRQRKKQNEDELLKKDPVAEEGRDGNSTKESKLNDAAEPKPDDIQVPRRKLRRSNASTNNEDDESLSLAPRRKLRSSNTEVSMSSTSSSKAKEVDSAAETSRTEKGINRPMEEVKPIKRPRVDEEETNAKTFKRSKTEVGELLKMQKQEEDFRNMLQPDEVQSESKDDLPSAPKRRLRGSNVSSIELADKPSLPRSRRRLRSSNVSALGVDDDSPKVKSSDTPGDQPTVVNQINAAIPRKPKLAPPPPRPAEASVEATVDVEAPIPKKPKRSPPPVTDKPQLRSKGDSKGSNSQPMNDTDSDVSSLSTDQNKKKRSDNNKSSKRETVEILTPIARLSRTLKMIAENECPLEDDEYLNGIKSSDEESYASEADESLEEPPERIGVGIPLFYEPEDEFSSDEEDDDCESNISEEEIQPATNELSFEQMWRMKLDETAEMLRNGTFIGHC